MSGGHTNEHPRANWHQDVFGLLITLSLGPGEGDGEWTEAQLRRGWTIYREKVMAKPRNSTRVDRPYGWWRFEAGEEMPASEPDQLVRLLELGELSAEEVVMVERRAREALWYVEWADLLEAAGHVVTSPRSAREGMRARREADAPAWRQVLEAGR